MALKDTKQPKSGLFKRRGKGPKSIKKKDMHEYCKAPVIEAKAPFVEAVNAAVAKLNKVELHFELIERLRKVMAEAGADIRDDAPLLSVKDLVVHYETEEAEVEAVNGISFDLYKQRSLGLVGETGAGKTTTALSIMNLVPEPVGRMRSGEILLDQVDLLQLPTDCMEAIRGNDVAMIFQDPMTALNPVMTVGEQIAESYELHRHGISAEEARQQAREMLELVGIPGSRADDYPHQFSGGMRQRVVIAIALACRPRLLIADEPTTALDVTIQAQVLTLIKKLIKDYEMSLLLITHDLGVVAEVCDDVAVMYAGSLVEVGSADEIFNDTLHPYTEGLFDSLPNLRQRGEDLKPIKGLMPDPADLPPGCAFAPRCPYADERCRTERPKLVKVAGTHAVACSAYERPGFVLASRAGKGATPRQTLEQADGQAVEQPVASVEPVQEPEKEVRHDG